MATYAELTDEQKGRLQANANKARILMARTQQLARECKIVLADFQGTVQAIGESLGQSEVIPNATNLDGASSLERDFYLNVMIGLITDVAAFDDPTKLAQAVIAAGINATAQA